MVCEPDRYLQFGDERLRPALDRIVDPGCGPGSVTRPAVLDCLSSTISLLCLATGSTLFLFRRFFLLAQR